MLPDRNPAGGEGGANQDPMAINSKLLLFLKLSTQLGCNLQPAAASDSVDGRLPAKSVSGNRNSLALSSCGNCQAKTRYVNAVYSVHELSTVRIHTLGCQGCYMLHSSTATGRTPQSTERADSSTQLNSFFP